MGTTTFARGWRACGLLLSLTLALGFAPVLAQDATDDDPNAVVEQTWDETTGAEAADTETFGADLYAAYPNASEWPPFSANRWLDVSVYEPALSDLTPERIAALDALVLEADIPALTAAMDRGDLTAVELTAYYLHRILSFDIGLLNAIIALNPDALAVAEARDAQRAQGLTLGPLHGIPVLLKDNIATGEPMPTSAGAMALADSYADRDALAVKRLRDAGAIILGKTNMSEWSNWMHYAVANGYSALGGQVVSPYGAWLDPSGSSTGSAVAVTANFAAFALGTETMGSIISPSSRASIVGMDPSLGLVSRDYVLGLSDEYDSVGPMGRSVTDVAIALTILARQPDPTDDLSTDAATLNGADFTAALDAGALEGARIGLLALDPSLSDEEQLAFYGLEATVATLQAAGAEVVIVRPDPLPDLSWGTVISCDLQQEVNDYLTAIQSPLGGLSGVVAFNDFFPAGFAPYGQEQLLESLACPFTPEEVAAMAAQDRATARGYMQNLFDSTAIDALVFVDDLMALEYGAAGNPAITVPRGLTEDGAPTGLTFTGPFLSDARLIGYAYAFEQASQARVPPDIVAEPQF